MQLLNTTELAATASCLEALNARGRMTEAFVDALAKARVGIALDSNPARSDLSEGWNDFVQAPLRARSFPLEYASLQHTQLSVPFLPGLVRSHERAQRLSRSDFMIDVKAIVAAAGAVVLADVWRMGAFASRHEFVRGPATVRGLRVQAVGPAVARMLAAAGATVVSLPPGEIYAALKYGRLDAVVTSLESHASLRLFEQADWLTVPGDNALCFMYEPVLAAKPAFDRLYEFQRTRLLAAGREMEAVFEAEAQRSDHETIDAMRDAGANICGMEPVDYYEWLAIARRSSYVPFACNTLGGDALITKALAAG